MCTWREQVSLVLWCSFDITRYTFQRAPRAGPPSPGRFRKLPRLPISFFFISVRPCVKLCSFRFSGSWNCQLSQWSHRMCKAVHPFLSQHLVRVLTEDAVEALADDEKMLLGPHLCPHNQVQALLGSGYVIEGMAWKRTCASRVRRGVGAMISLCVHLSLLCESEDSCVCANLPSCHH